MTFRTVSALALFLPLAACSPQDPPAAPAAPPAPAVSVERGSHLAVIGGCHECHTPKTPTDHGPVPDLTRALSGHPESVGALPAPSLAAPWRAATTADMTAWAGPWGISFAANLTPDEETGYGVIDEGMFLASMRNGLHFSTGRPILPPMPWQAIGQMSDDDLKSLYAYMRSLPPVKNRVPEPVPPAGPPAH